MILFRCWPFMLLIVLALPLTLCGEETGKVRAGSETPESVELKLTSVTLHAAGKGWFEYTGTVDGAGVFRIPVGEFELDEAIRVSRLIDPAGGGEIRIASPADPVQPLEISPSTRTFGDLLMSMKGQPIKAKMHAGMELEGVLVSVEQHADLVGEVSVDREYITVLTELGLQTELVEEIATIRPTDAAFNERLNATLAESGNPVELPRQDVEFVFASGPSREVTVGVMRSVPMWKVSYRVEGDHLIHRSIVDNTSGIDWEGVQLHLLDGNPVLFTMDLRSVSRARLEKLKRPSSHAGIAPSFGESLGDMQSSAQSGMSDGSEWDGVDLFMGEPFGGGAMGGMGGGGMGGGGGAIGAIQSRNDPSESAGEDAFASFNQLFDETPSAPAGSTLQLQFDAVDLLDGKTALLDTEIAPVTIEEVSVYRESYHPTATLLCLEVENETSALLPAGPLSVMAGERQRAILGEVVLPALGPQTKRLVGYAMDGGVRVTPSRIAISAEPQSMTIDEKRHRIEVVTLHRRVRKYEVLNRSGEDRDVVLEIPLPLSPYEIQVPQDDEVTVEKADEFHRIRFNIADGKSRTQETVEQRSSTDVSQWGTVSLTQLENWLAEEYWDDALKKRLSEVLSQRRKLDDTNRVLGDLLAMRKELISEIERVSNQFTRSTSPITLPKEVLARYQTRILELETRREQAEQQMLTLATTRRDLLGALGMPRDLPKELSPLRAFVPNVDNIDQTFSPMIEPVDDKSPLKPSTPPASENPSSGDPFGN
ncbi:hypothetical protein NB063_30525 [Rhodopirellula sp. ICT_H3.1]|uniref:DUF4139 domain-containing protein n=2 Tax=Aporhodopirellula aestuarii TaxID=2950107 RepID=A0ABT0UE20_9BACT|nr:hypothetical protein [Aporhodopirellula aestuarii]